MIGRRPASVAEHRTRLGALGESLAAAFLQRHGLVVRERNVTVGRGEIDVIGVEGVRPVAVEVKTAIASDVDHPRDHFTDAKARQVRELARTKGIGRVDLVTVAISTDGARIDWHRRV